MSSGVTLTLALWVTAALVALAFIASANGRVARHQTNSRLAAMFATLCFQPVDEKPMIGGV